MARKSVIAALFAASLAAALPSFAADEPNTLDNPAEVARQAAEKIMQALKIMIDNIPQYSAPELLPNGDIIIRRKHDPSPQPLPPSDKDTRT
ncbi:MAG TPA: hypothetical protein VEU47_08620 [Candidatus Cybelea sp.]|nr:hypothetical protein [Candidatus Cybelea sp.]